ncbi:TPA: hypothetical protein DCW38_03850 [candidate division WOR-3 bacterium]|jgi:hypothetical protein|uniref:Uncharacterized protein n=1 Tax=candidate division WOR-3 bacterium TaxID=2052148 RepID=A0A350H9S9_UNCW3|nr:hypothetical protein [candidate division WOR-3 bacterium]
MNKFCIILAVFSFSFFLFAQKTPSKTELLFGFDKTEREIKKNVGSISIEIKSRMNMSDNDFSIISRVNDFIDSVSFENIMIDNVSNDTFISDGSFKTIADKIKMTSNGSSYDLYLYSSNGVFTHNLKHMLPDSFMIQRENSVLRIVSLESAHPLVQMYLDAGTLRLKSFQFKSYLAIYNVKIASYRNFKDYLSIPDSIEVFINEERVMVSGISSVKVNYK